MSKLFITDHPLIQHKMGLLRDKNTSTKDFRELIEEIATLICYEATRDLPLSDKKVDTPICDTVVKETLLNTALVPILRAGIGMVDGMLNLMPAAHVGHIGMYRDPKTLKPVEYYCKLPPNLDKSIVFVLDPMLATGGTAVESISFLKKGGCQY